MRLEQIMNGIDHEQGRQTGGQTVVRLTRSGVERTERVNDFETAHCRI